MGTGSNFCGCFQNFQENEAILSNLSNQNDDNNNIKNLNINEKNIDRVQQNNDKISNAKTEFDKNLCNMIFKSLPRRETTQLQAFKETLKEKIKNLSDKEIAYILFLWVCDNIIYDVESFFAGRNVDCEPEGVFIKGTTVCSGYARLYKNIGEFIGLGIQCVSCYCKGVGYQPGKNLTSTNHEYNIIKLDNNYYPIDCTWGSGNIEGNSFTKKLNEFYFLTNPEYLIKTHFPVNDRWQLTKKKYTKDEFLKWPKISFQFYSFGFNKYEPEEGVIELNSNTKKFIIWGNDISKNNASSNIYLLENNIYQQQLNLNKITFLHDRIEFDFIFNKKGKYNIELFANDDKGQITQRIMNYIVNVHNNAKEELKFPYCYSGSNDINIIEPLYDNLKSGEKVKFKIKTSLAELDTLIIIDGQWHYLNRNDDGFFEKEILIQTQPGKSLIIGKRKDNNDCSCSYLVAYDIIK